MKRTIFALVSLCVLLLLVFFVTEDLKSSNYVNCKQLIKVVDDNGSPIQGASVVIKEHPNGSVIGSCTTNLTGYCPSEANLVQGQVYIIQANANPGPGSGSTVFTACVSPEVVVEVK